MTRGLAYWVLMLIWLVVGIAWHFALIGAYGVLGVAIIPFLLFALLGWQVFWTAAAMSVPAGYLTPNFSLAEFITSDTAAMSGIDNTPSDVEVDELAETAELMELVRALCGDNPVYITSGYRCPELNAAVGGADNSAHLYGCGVDFTIPDFGTPLEVARAIEPHVNEWNIDQLIYEMTWVHIGRAPPPSTPRCQCLTINNGGTQNGIVA